MKWFRPFFDILVILVNDECGSENQLGEIEHHPDVDETCRCRVFSGRSE
jgi:hypothetical protein